MGMTFSSATSSHLGICTSQPKETKKQRIKESKITTAAPVNTERLAQTARASMTRQQGG
jgi:hypothetical protein